MVPGNFEDRPKHVDEDCYDSNLPDECYVIVGRSLSLLCFGESFQKIGPWPAARVRHRYIASLRVDRQEVK